MTRRGRLTLALPVAAAALGALAFLSDGVRIAELGRLLEPPAELRLAAVEAAPPKGTAPPELLGRLPVSKEAFEAALATADWIPPDPPPGTRLWETVSSPGGDGLPLRVEYTFDTALSRATFALLERARVKLGHILVLDPARDELLAYASTDVEKFPPTRAYPAASLIKVVTAAAALDDDPRLDAHRCVFSGNPWRLGRRQLDPPRKGTEVSLGKALATSNNQCFAQLAVHDLGTARMLAAIRRFGLLEPAGPAHVAGRADDPGEDPLALGRLGCGLDGCRITPLHAVRLAGTLADGTLVEPRWVSRVVDGAGRELALPPRPDPRPVLTEELSRQLRTLMVATTTRGTARRGFRDARGRPMVGPVEVAGKTGSLSGRDPDGRYEWFIGVAPAEKPRVAVAVLLVQGHLWWRNSSQVAGETFRLLFCEKGSCSPSGVDRWFPPEPTVAEVAYSGRSSSTAPTTDPSASLSPP